MEPNAKVNKKGMHSKKCGGRRTKWYSEDSKSTYKIFVLVERGDDVVTPAVRIDFGSDKLLLLPPLILLLALVVDAVIASSSRIEKRDERRRNILMESFFVVDSVWYDNDDGMETTRDETQWEFGGGWMGGSCSRVRVVVNMIM